MKAQRSKYEQRSPRQPVPVPFKQRARLNAGWRYTSLMEAYSFFRENAGGIVGESVRIALDLARAERDAEEYGLAVEWEADDEAGSEYYHGRYAEYKDAACCQRAMRRCQFERHNCGRSVVCDRHDEHMFYGAVVHRDDEPEYGWALWGIDDNDPRGYGRVVAAELLSEALASIRKDEDDDMQRSRERGRQYVGMGV